MSDFSEFPDDEEDPITLSPVVEEFLGDPGTPAPTCSPPWWRSSSTYGRTLSRT
ncbi:hypothetical protein [Kitasatospora sp. A2-31]|uniref:hypothetical protein n=1 Tax=Kitasatospora sp. A2-31 TaxID=2916414 RepID=UPI001EEAAB7C|nr:hypothetical protein [Kitasatospora sp. A2-31]MCG6498130.1 hypothetical protein [Kitasatospora sp. A2-31]